MICLKAVANEVLLSLLRVLVLLGSWKKALLTFARIFLGYSLVECVFFGTRVPNS